MPAIVTVPALNQEETSPRLDWGGLGGGDWDGCLPVASPGNMSKGPLNGRAETALGTRGSGGMERKLLETAGRSRHEGSVLPWLTTATRGAWVVQPAFWAPIMEQLLCFLFHLMVSMVFQHKHAGRKKVRRNWFRRHDNHFNCPKTTGPGTPWGPMPSLEANAAQMPGRPEQRLDTAAPGHTAAGVRAGSVGAGTVLLG